MLKTYPNELKANLMARMLPPTSASVPALVRETGIPKDTLYGWRRQALAQGASAAPQPVAPGTPSGAEKLAVVIETAALNAHELGEYCRRKGLFPEQIAVWRTRCEQAVEPLPSKAERAERRCLSARRSNASPASCNARTRRWPKPQPY